MDYADVEVEQKVLGEGTSGSVRKGVWKGQEVAVKVYKSKVTSDGSPKDEMQVPLHCFDFDSGTGSPVSRT